MLCRGQSQTGGKTTDQCFNVRLKKFQLNWMKKDYSAKETGTWRCTKKIQHGDVFRGAKSGRQRGVEQGQGVAGSISTFPKPNKAPGSADVDSVTKAACRSCTRVCVHHLLAATTVPPGSSCSLLIYSQCPIGKSAFIICCYQG